MIEYSQNSRRAVARLFRPYNDIDIYVEDKTFVGVYEKMINRALKGQARVSKIIPLGPKSEVLRQAANDLASGGRPRLYIVDGDLDLVAFQRQPSYPHLHRLNVYSLENLLVDLRAFERYCSFVSPAMAGGTCYTLSNPEQLLEEVQELLPLIVNLAVARRLGIAGPATAFNPPSVTRTVSGKHIGPDKAKILARNREILRLLVGQVGVERYRQAKAAVKINIVKRSIADHRIVPGKPFIMMYLNERVASAGGAGLPQKLLVSFLADHATFDLDKRLATRLRRVAKLPR